MSLIDQIFEPGQAVLSGPSVLVVDDELAHRELTSARLEIAGFNVYEVADGYEALKLIKERNFDATVVDTEMDKMFGYEFCSAARESPSGKRLAILGISGNLNFVDYKERWEEADVDLVLDKMEINRCPYLLEKGIYSAIDSRKRI